MGDSRGVIRFLLANQTYSSPNSMEHTLYLRRELLAKARPLLLCYAESCAFCNPLNIVSPQSQNRYYKDGNYSAEYLAECFDNGLKIDVKPFFDFTPKGCHEN